MRAVWLGLVGIVAVVGTAGAAECRLDGLELVAVADRIPADASFKGAKFRIVRQASQFKTGPDPAKGRVTTRGTITVEIVGNRGRFFVQQDYEPTSMPWVSAGSWAAADRPAVHWNRRSRRDERQLFGPDGSFDVYGGPLAGYSLRATNCRSGGQRSLYRHRLAGE